jgi:ubiquinone/menaquinone biosynthesis C-methylase UbiE
MGVYSKYFLPRLTELAMRSRTLRPERERWVPLARGVVLEVGVGSGLNIPIYSGEVRKLYALDPSEELLRMARSRAARASFPVEFLSRPAAAIPLADGSVDDIVTTWTLCTIPDPVAALQEVCRVLRPEGRLIFVEHGRSSDPAVVWWQDRLTPFWQRVAGGCQLNRPIDRLLRSGGFEVLEMKRGYVAGPRIGSYLYRGIARPASDGRAAPDLKMAEKGIAHVE